MKNRIPEIDALRYIAAFCIIFAHIDSFTSLPILKILESHFGSFGLNTFFFFSGFLMYSNNKFTTAKDVIFFFKRRVAKIYPLFWLSIIIIYFMNIFGFDVLYSNDISANKVILFLNILGLQGLGNISLSIWWFIGVILLYYFLFSIILHYSQSVRSVLINSFLIFILLLFLKNEFNLINDDAFNYYIIFIAGILSAIAENLNSFKKITLSYFIFLLSLLLISYSGITTTHLLNISKRDIMFMMFAFIFTFYKIKFSFNSEPKVSSLIERLADSSYSIYLFHIPVLTVFKLSVDLLIPFEVSNGYLPDYLILFIGVPFTLFAGYFINIYFDKFYKKLAFNIKLWKQVVDNI